MCRLLVVIHVMTSRSFSHNDTPKVTHFVLYAAFIRVVKVSAAALLMENIAREIL